MARRPQETAIALAAVLGGLWIGINLMHCHRDAKRPELMEQLPDFEYRDLSPAELEAETSFRFQDNAPTSWDDISLRGYAEDQQLLTKFLRCTIDADEVDVTSPAIYHENRLRYRSVDELPPDWWPAVGDPDAGKWAIPGWWRPENGVGIWWMSGLNDDRVIGHYLHYDRETRVLHLWEWWRRVEAVGRPGIAETALEHLMSVLMRRLAVAHHPTTADGWLHAIRYRADDLGVDPALLPEGMQSIDALILGKADRPRRYLCAIEGIDETQAADLLSDYPMRRIADHAETGPPVARWSFALPEREGAPWTPTWFTTGPGPRWAYTVVRPGSRAVEMGRWAAYDPERERLLVWSWLQHEQPRPPAADILSSLPNGDAVDAGE